MISSFNAVQLIDFMTKASPDPKLRLISLFDCLEAILNQESGTPVLEQEHIFNASLQQYCIQLSRESKAHYPETLADHLLFIAQNAFNQQINQPTQEHLMHAKKVAEALILAQVKAQTHFFCGLSFFYPFRYAIAASFSIILLGGIFLWNQNAHEPPIALSTSNTLENLTVSRGEDASLTAQEASAMYAKYETMRSGTCQFIEALQIPDKDKSVYLESVVGGKLPNNLKDLQTANAYLEKVRCNYTPMLMRNSK